MAEMWFVLQRVKHFKNRFKNGTYLLRAVQFTVTRLAYLINISFYSYNKTFQIWAFLILSGQ